MSSWWRAVWGAAIAATGWIIGGSVMRYLFDDSPAVSAYASLVGWWFTAYLSSRFDLPIITIVPLGVVSYVLFLIAAIGGYTWFYRDAYALTVPMALGLGLAQAFIVSSPIVFDWTFRQVIRVCFRNPV